jgi:hypothetical protein
MVVCTVHRRDDHTTLSAFAGRISARKGLAAMEEQIQFNPNDNE